MDSPKERFTERHRSYTLGTPSSNYLIRVSRRNMDKSSFWRSRWMYADNWTSQFDRNKPAMEAINIAIIGVEGVGKSAFVQRTIRSTRPPTQNMITFRHVLDGTQYSVTLVELDLEGFELDPRQPIQWPKQVAGHMVPRIDGALILYDVTNKESVRGLDSTMAALANSSLPTVLAATKCDAPDEARQIDVADVASAFPTCAGHFRTSFNVPGSAQDCLQAALKAALANKRGENIIAAVVVKPGD